ncbi:MAG: FAD:protein FMN transferase [Planctomycetes bacterium]|nr:FAD:protein FMN transferase [Planctomycetota bacterium]
MRFVLLLGLLVASGARAETLALRGATMGTTYHIKFVAEPGSIDAARLQADVEKVLAEIDRQMSTYRPDSELIRFNRAPAGEWFAVSAATAKVVAAAQAISKKTDGAMDVTVGPLVRLWHFGPPTGDDNKFVPPTDKAIAAARKRVGYQNLEVRMKPPALRKKIDDIEVDLSSIAPGYAIDRLARLMVKRGLKNFMVELGGEVRAAGRRQDGQPWRIAVERPSAGERELQSSVALDNASIATAGDYRKFFEHQGRRFSHIIDPATGRPVEHSLASVTVVADTCMAADGWDTPLLVLGPERGYECAKKHNVAAMFIWRDGKKYDVRETPAWRARVNQRQHAQ